VSGRPSTTSIAAFALDAQATLATNDPEFRALRPDLKLLEL